MDETRPSVPPQQATTRGNAGAQPGAAGDQAGVAVPMPGGNGEPVATASALASAVSTTDAVDPDDPVDGVDAHRASDGPLVDLPGHAIAAGVGGPGANTAGHAADRALGPTAVVADLPGTDGSAARSGAQGGATEFDPSGAARPAYLHRGDTPWSILGRIIRARGRALFQRAGQRITQRTLHIGVSARIFHPEPDGVGLRGKTLQYLEESIAHWIMSRDVIVFMIPTVAQQGMLHYSNIRLRDYASHLDALVLQGGADVSPQSYSLHATRPEWPGDRVRDMYELELLHAFVEAGKPVLGVCRGCQLINVAFGGTLYQDIMSDVPEAQPHVADSYDRHRHAITFPPGSSLAGMFAGTERAMVNSIHHQAVRTFGPDVSVEARSSDDGIVEAIRYRKAPFVVGVQWHPEFHRAGGEELLDCTPLLDHFLRAARETRF